MEQIRFKTGEMRTFIATRNFALGSFNVTVDSGSELQYDGSTVEYAGQSYPFPQLRGAIKAGWLQLPSEYDEDDPNNGRPVSANIQVRHPTDGGNPMEPQAKRSIVTTESDERVVGNASTHAAATKTANTNQGRRMATVDVGGVESQDGVPVRSLKSPAVSRTSLANASAAKAAAENIQIDAGESVNTEDTMLAAMSEEDRETYLAQKAARRSQYVDDPAPTRQIVSKVVAGSKTKTSEGITATTKVGGGVETADPVDPGNKAEETVHYEDGIKMTNTNGPKNAAPQPARQVEILDDDGTLEARRLIAKKLCPDFPDNYDFAASPRKKLARLMADFEDRDDVILAAFAAENDGFKAQLQSEFPSAFGG